MEHSSSPSAIVCLIALILVFFTSFPSSLKCSKRVRSKVWGNTADETSKLYEDEDGIATEETQNSFSAALPKYIALVSSLLGLSASTSLAVFSTVHSASNLRVEYWLSFGTWICLVGQTTYIVLERDPVERFNSGALNALAYTLLTAATCTRVVIHLSYLSSFRSHNAFLVLDLLQFCAGVICLLACLSLPRRPVVEDEGTPVEGQYTVSTLGRYTWSWAGVTLVSGRNKKDFGLDDLPKLHVEGRSAYLQEYFKSMKKRDHLWKTLFFAHLPELLFQTAFTILSSAAQFLPQLVMYQLLKRLESRTEGNSTDKAIWGLVAALGLAILFSAWTQNWLIWIVWARLGHPIRTELSALIFGKATRRKDVKGMQKSQQATNVDAGSALNVVSEVLGSNDQETVQTHPISGSNPGQAEKVKAEDTSEEDIQKSRQSTINLIGVDAKRISDFIALHYVFPQTAVTLTISVSFLITLIGWKSLFAGLSVFVFVLPLNIYASRRYTDAQGVLMKVRDQKMVVVTEALQGIRQIKFSAQEQQWQEKIGKKRDEELATQWRVFCLDTILIGIWILGPVMLSAVALTVYAVLNGGLSASIAFTSIAVMGSMEASLAVLPEVIADALEAWVSTNRIDEYLKAPERDPYIIPSDVIDFEHASIAWPSDSQEEDFDRFALKNVNVRFPKRELSVISGKTGSGKSLLLASILGEADLLAGNIRVPQAPSSAERFDYKANRSDWIIDSAIAFVAQIPWIENATIKDNILFGLPFDSGRYKKVISCCALEKDLTLLPDGELTDIGANGINLSGGQRWRISFARALYSRAGILVLDDIFSAVDAHVGRQLFEDALTGDLGAGRTRILVTHHVGLVLPKTAYTVILTEGTVEHAGVVEDLRGSGVLEKLVKQQQEGHEKGPKLSEAPQEAKDIDNVSLSKVISHVAASTKKFDEGELDVQAKTQPKKFTEDEKRETGRMGAHVYRQYLVSSGGFWFWGPIMVLYAVYQGLILGRSWFIGIWTRSYKAESHLFYVQVQTYGYSPGRNSAYDTATLNGNLSFYLGIYFGLSVIICIFGALKYFFVFMGSLRASKKLFENLTYTVLRAPLRWLDTTPVGRTLNRFTADFAAIDSRLGNDVGFLLYHVLALVGIIIAGLFVSPIMLLFALLLLLLCGWVTGWYLSGAREVKRLESNAKSPVFEQFGSVLIGIGTIRAFDRTDVYIKRMFAKIDTHAKSFWFLWLCSRWLAFRSFFIGAVFSVLVAAIVAFYGIEASLAGFALSFALQYSNAIMWTTRCYANCELNFNAVERVAEYADLPIEKQSASIKVSAAWPTEGRLQVSDLVAGYAADLPPVLKGLSFDVERNQRVGVVGRTGAGKSSLTLALFRFLEAREGSVHIDGIDISKISLHDLRSRIAIIPQDPVLFSGTVRSNLDPFDQHTDGELYDALQRVHLIRTTGTTSRDESTRSASGSNSPVAEAAADTNSNPFASLSSRISEGGLNLSQGQRQLLCLARAIVARPKIMVLDEATSAVDMATDVLIQRSIREEFRDSTLIVIAHRLSTIADFDKILVMDDGVGVEFDGPKELLEKEKGVFNGMVEQSGERQRLWEIIGSSNEVEGIGES